MKNTILVLLLSLTMLNSKAQDYKLFPQIGATEDEIKARMNSEGAVMKLDKFMLAFGTAAHREMDYQFPNGVSGNGDIYFAKFFLSKHNNQCFRYDIWYRNDRSLKKLTDQLNDPNSGWKKSGNGLKWVNSKLEIEIIRPERKTENKSAAFVFQMGTAVRSL